MRTGEKQVNQLISLIYQRSTMLIFTLKMKPAMNSKHLNITKYTH